MALAKKKEKKKERERCSTQWQTKSQGSTNVSKPAKNSNRLTYLHTRNINPSHHATDIKPCETSSIKIVHLTEHSTSLLHLIQILHIWFFSKDDQFLWFHVWDKFCMQETSAMVGMNAWTLHHSCSLKTMPETEKQGMPFQRISYLRPNRLATM